MDVYIREGSHYDARCPFSKVFYRFPANEFEPEHLLHVLADSEARSTWDSNITESSVLNKVSDSLSLIHIGIKAPFPYSNRDFVQKRVHFKADGAFYSYFSSTQDMVRPVERHNGRELYVRGQMIIGYQVLRRVGDCWRLFIAAQTDLKVKRAGRVTQMKIVPHKLVKVVFPKTQEKWYQRFRKAVEGYRIDKEGPKSAII